MPNSKSPSSKKHITKYLHTFNGRPATFCEGHIMYAMPLKLVDSLRQIRAEQKADRHWRDKQNISVIDARYDYVRIRV